MSVLTVPNRWGRKVKPARRGVQPARPSRSIRAGEVEEAVSTVSSALTIVAVLCGWMLLQLLVLGNVSQERSQHLLYGELRRELAAATAPTGALDFEGKPVQPGAPVALIRIPKLNKAQVVVSGTASGDLMAGPGHLRSTPLPGQAGQSVVMGRGRTYGAPFRDLGLLSVGDPITVQNASGAVTYKVTAIRRAGDPVTPFTASGTKGRLTLVTAEGSGFLSALRSRTVLYVDAETQQATPAGPVPQAVPASELTMARDSAALPTLVLLLAGAIALVLGVTLARRRFRGVLVWTAAVPLAVALAWATTDQVVRLLPNLM